MQTITFIPPERGRPCDSCTKCCQWLTAEVDGFAFGEGVACKFLAATGCSRYSTRPDGCRSFQCLWKTDLTIPEWLKPNLVDVIMKQEYLGNFNYITVVHAGNPAAQVLDWCKQEALKGTNFIIHNTGEVISNNKDFEDLIKVISKKY